MAARRQDVSKIPPSNDGTSDVILDALRAELAEERARKASLETRALAGAAASAAALSLVFALIKDIAAPYEVLRKVLLLMAVVAFIAGAAAGWFAARARNYREIDPKEYDTLLEDLDSGKGESKEAVRRFLAEGMLEVLQEARSINNDKADWFGRSATCLAIGALFIFGHQVLLIVTK